MTKNKRDETMIGFEQEIDQIMWDWKKGRYDKVMRDHLLESVGRDIKEYKQSKVQNV
jgi:hypothetical protein